MYGKSESEQTLIGGDDGRESVGVVVSVCPLTAIVLPRCSRAAVADIGRLYEPNGRCVELLDAAADAATVDCEWFVGARPAERVVVFGMAPPPAAALLPAVLLLLLLFGCDCSDPMAIAGKALQKSTQEIHNYGGAVMREKVCVFQVTCNINMLQNSHSDAHDKCFITAV